MRNHEQGLLSFEQASRMVRDILQAASARGIFPALNDQNFSNAFKAYSGHVKAVLTNRSCPFDLLEDVSQEVWTRVWEKREQYDPAKSPLSTWLAVLAQRVWFNHHRDYIASQPETISITQMMEWHTGRDYRGNSRPYEEEDFCPPALSHEELSNLELDLTKLLKPAELQLLKLDLEGLTHQEIGSRLDISAAAVRSRLARMRDKLRAAGVYKDERNG